ncbi:cobyric acid synthase [Ruegeria pomeroyi]|uniref:Cobyric acid synthase n=2 Tax=Ruegeria pomeroyi TaxID=89184 RepID=Q5LU17_RUEPO|nr:cobyric acid synthase [Ruegeria pomeroyi]AAV94535.1 cobyric acid synthase CobQ [Ruegeria pomeroyi DSS-3]NVK99234.1 cobyric acid synthase [Ruegeria pomeroyi]NVL01469.1 cobyric acid synthase [Ruegeria pomeroyi]QWV08119.1 cobyric acid synthase [Ruegeria pomeroyi]
MVRAIMIQGTGSNVGKSMLVAGLARAFTRRGLRVAPFKPQNMSNNAAATENGGEIGRAQALQARAARRATHTDMNPILLKPETDTGAQIVVQGKRAGTMRAGDYRKNKAHLLEKALESFDRLCGDADLVLIEGAGSPAETNLRAGDIANMGFACAAGVPVVLVGDIHRGGVIAQIVGTQAVLEPGDLAQIRGFAVNRFKGDITLFDEGRDDIARRTGWPCLGVVPWFNDAWRLPAEDMMDIRSAPGGACKVVVPQLERMANFDDLDPLAAEPGVSVEIIPAGRPLPGDADLVLLPGSKSTVGDLAYFRAQGWDIDLYAHVRRGGHVLGLCGGYQMLGHSIDDPEGIEGRPGRTEGLGLLDVHTVMTGDKQVTLRHATALPGREPVTGYEIHIGRTDGPDCARAWLEIDGRPEGAATPDGRIRGSYLHGLFASDAFRARYLGELGHEALVGYEDGVEQVLEALADHVEAHLDLDLLLSLAEPPRRR